MHDFLLLLAREAFLLREDWSLLAVFVLTAGWCGRASGRVGSGFFGFVERRFARGLEAAERVGEGGGGGGEGAES
jgi:hypothetical protein